MPKSQEICIKFTITDCSNSDKRCSDAHFVPLLFYYNCTNSFLHYFSALCSKNDFGLLLALGAAQNSLLDSSRSFFL